MLAGITHAFKSGYLANIVVFMLLFSITSTFIYFQQADIVSRSFSDRGAQTAFFASIDLAVNIVTLIVELFLTARIVRLLGVGVTLALLPLITIIGFGTLALLPTITGADDRAGRAALGRLRDRAADARSALHRRAARGPLQDQELHRYGGVSHRRPARRLVLCAVDRARPAAHADCRCRGVSRARVATQRPVARPPPPAAPLSSSRQRSLPSTGSICETTLWCSSSSDSGFSGAPFAN